MPDHDVSDSGGTMTRLVGAANTATTFDPADLEALRRDAGISTRPAGEPPHFTPGEQIVWRFNLFADAMVVVRDDERGLVAWLPEGSERLTVAARDGRSLRARSKAEMAQMFLSQDYDVCISRWRGAGVLRIAPTGRPWSVWWFRDDDGEFAGHYVNLELPHVRPVVGDAATMTRDLVLDLWLGPGGDVWLKDADELAAFTAAGVFTQSQHDLVHVLADIARRELIEPRAWPLDEGWETWRPPAAWDRPIALPPSARP